MRDESRFIRSLAGAALLVALALAAFAPPGRAGVTVAFQPATLNVSPGAEFDLTIVVTQSGSAFNAFDAIVGYDPAALTLVPLSPLSLQEGSLMTGACSNTFHQFEQGADRDTITDALLCNATSVTGPGEIYRLRFRAATTPQNTTVRFLPGLQFYNAGLYVTPVASSSATIGIGGAAAVGDPGGPGPRLRVRASPNPAHGAATLRVDSDRPGTQEVLVLDALGRVVRHVERGVFQAAARAIEWDGRSDAGARLPAGVYTILLRTPAGAARTHLILID